MPSCTLTYSILNIDIYRIVATVLFPNARLAQLGNVSGTALTLLSNDIQSINRVTTLPIQISRLHILLDPIIQIVHTFYANCRAVCTTASAGASSRGQHFRE